MGHGFLETDCLLRFNANAQLLCRARARGAGGQAKFSGIVSRTPSVRQQVLNITKKGFSGTTFILRRGLERG